MWYCKVVFDNCTTYKGHILQYHTISYSLSYYTIYHTILHHIILYHITYTIYHTIPYHTIPYSTILCHAMPCHAMPHDTIPYRYHIILYHNCTTWQHNTIQCSASHHTTFNTCPHLLKKSVSETIEMLFTCSFKNSSVNSTQHVSPWIVWMSERNFSTTSCIDCFLTVLENVIEKKLANNPFIWQH